MRYLAVIAAALLLAAAPAMAGRQPGISQVQYQTYDPPKYLRTADCHLTDSYVIDSFGGSLAPGQSFSTYLDLCYEDQYSLLYGVDEETDEDFAFGLNARGDLSVGLTIIRRDFPDRALPVAKTPGKPLDSWIGCAYPSYWTTYKPDGFVDYGGARILVSLSNPTSHIVRDIALSLYLNLAGFVGHGC